MKCINCRGDSGGLFLCKSCTDVGDRNEALLKKGLTVVSVDPKSGKQITTVYKDTAGERNNPPHR